MSTNLSALAAVAVEYPQASRCQKGKLLDYLVGETGWSRDHARRMLRIGGANQASKLTIGRPSGSRKYSKQAVDALEYMWRIAGQPSGRHLVAIMPRLIGQLSRSHEIPTNFGANQIAQELCTMSSATIDRYLRATRSAEQESAERLEAWAPPREPVPTASSPNDAHKRSGVFTIDVVSHCAEIANGPHLYTLLLEHFASGWSSRRTVVGNSPVHLYGAMDWLAHSSPVPVREVLFGNGGGYLNWSVLAWGDERGVAIDCGTRDGNSRVATSEHHGCVCADGKPTHSSVEASLMNQYWDTLMLRENFVLPNSRVTESIRTVSGKVKVYDQPKTPVERIFDSGSLAEAHAGELFKVDKEINPAAITQELERIAGLLSGLRQPTDGANSHSETPRSIRV